MLLGNVYIRGMEMPAASRGAVVEIEDDFIVFINTALSPDLQHKTVEHELRHIRSDHFYKDEPVVVDERQADEI